MSHDPSISETATSLLSAILPNWCAKSSKRFKTRTESSERDALTLSISLFPLTTHRSEGLILREPRLHSGGSLGGRRGRDLRRWFGITKPKWQRAASKV